MLEVFRRPMLWNFCWKKIVICNLNSAELLVHKISLKNSVVFACNTNGPVFVFVTRIYTKFWVIFFVLILYWWQKQHSRRASTSTSSTCTASTEQEVQVKLGKYFWKEGVYIQIYKYQKMRGRKSLKQSRKMSLTILS